jgi:hypothetical protein
MSGEVVGRCYEEDGVAHHLMPMRKRWFRDPILDRGEPCYCGAEHAPRTIRLRDVTQVYDFGNEGRTYLDGEV